MTRTRLLSVYVSTILCAAVAPAAEKLAPVPLLTPEDEAKTFVLPEGLRVEVVAAEPMVEHPVHIAFDPKGRMWVAEMRGYMPNLAGTGETKPTGRISVLEDTDGDGRMDKSTVFLDGLVLPRAVGFAGDGVLVGTPPNLLFCRDTDGDLKSDTQTVIATDYGIPENPENSANGLVYNLDNWVYSANAESRLRYVGDGKFEFSPLQDLGQFGLGRDDWGRLYFNTNSDYLRASLVPPHYSARNPRSPMALADTRIAADQKVFPTLAATINRGYREGFLRDGKLDAFTAACSPHIYRADLLPKDFYGNVFVCEATSAMIRRAVLKEDGLSLSTTNAYDGKEFLTSTYERFRPVNFATGPEGALYIVDMHHGLIQHKMSLTEFAKDGYAAKKLDKHLRTGRIFRVVPDKGAPATKVDLAGATTPELLAHLTHPNAWYRETAQRLLVERKDASAADPLKRLATQSDSPVHRVIGLWTLDGIAKLDADTLLAAAADRHPRVRAAAAQLSDQLPLLAQLASDPDPVVHTHAVLTLAGIGTPDADTALADALGAHGSSAAIRQAAVSGLAGREIPFLQRLLADDGWSAADKWRTDVLTDIARSVTRRDDAKELTELVALIGGDALSDAQRNALADAVPARRQNAYGSDAIIDLPAPPAALAKLPKKSADRVAGLFAWPGKPTPPRPQPKPLTPAEQALFELGQVTYTQVCAQCHQPDGRGQEGKAPPLADSPWVTGPDSRLIRIVLHGVRGPITVNDKQYNMDMPGLLILSDDQIAGVLTYIRRSWGHAESPVDPKVVQNTRDWNQARRDGWTEPELLKLR